MTDKKTAGERAEEVSYADSRARLDKMQASLAKTEPKLTLRVASDNAGSIENKRLREEELAAFTQANNEYIDELDKTYAALSLQLEQIRSARESALASRQRVRDMSAQNQITDERNLNN